MENSPTLLARDGERELEAKLSAGLAPQKIKRTENMALSDQQVVNLACVIPSVFSLVGSMYLVCTIQFYQAKYFHVRSLLPRLCKFYQNSNVAVVLAIQNQRGSCCFLFFFPNPLLHLIERAKPFDIVRHAHMSLLE